MESNLKFSWEWPSSTRISDNVQGGGGTQRNVITMPRALLSYCQNGLHLKQPATEQEGGVVKWLDLNIFNICIGRRKKAQQNGIIWALKLRRQGGESVAVMQSTFSKNSCFPSPRVSGVLDSFNWITTQAICFLSLSSTDNRTCLVNTMQ